MQTSGYRAWLEQRGLAKSSADTYVSDAKRVERHYGDLDELYSKDRLAGVLQELRYSADDARTNAPNPSKIPIDANPYKGLASYRSTVTRYREYREAGMSSDDPVPETPDEDDRLIHPLILLSNDTKDSLEYPLLHKHLQKPLHQWTDSLIRPVGNMVIQHQPLTKQRVRTIFHRVRL